MLRRVLTTLVVVVWAALTAVVGSGPAAAAPAPLCPPQTVETSTKSAMAVFTGEVTDVQRQERTDGQRGALFLHKVTVTRVYRGSQVRTESVQVLTDLTPRLCSLGKLVKGTTYMFFVTGDGAPWEASGSGGTKPADDQLVGQVVRLLGDGRAPVPPDPAKAEFTPVRTTEPTTLSRAAAPGLALVLVGLLGLVVVRGLARRSR